MPLLVICSGSSPCGWRLEVPDPLNDDAVWRSGEAPNETRASSYESGWDWLMWERSMWFIVLQYRTWKAFTVGISHEIPKLSFHTKSTNRKQCTQENCRRYSSENPGGLWLYQTVKLLYLRGENRTSCFNNELTAIRSICVNYILDFWISLAFSLFGLWWE